MNQNLDEIKEEPIGYQSFEQYREKALIKLGTRISIFFILTFIILSILFYNAAFTTLFGYIIALVAALFMLIHLRIYKKPKIVFALYGISGSIIALSSCFFILETAHYVDFLWMLVCTFTVYLGGYRKLGFGVLIFNAVGIAYFLFFIHNEHINTIHEFSTLQLTGAYVEILLSLFILAYLMHQFIRFQEKNDTQIKRYNRSLIAKNQVIENQNNQNIILLKEIHHRVKNNLQIIVSLLRLQKNELKSAESKMHFQEAINRILVMSSIHKKLYRQEDLNSVDLEQYIGELIGELKTLYGSNKQINIIVNSEFPNMDIKTLLPVGLLLNELASNSLKYAFGDNNEGTIEVLIKKSPSGFQLSYSDNGQWIQKSEKSGFGLELVEVFTSQLNGTKQFHSDAKGSHYLFELEFAI